MFVVITTGGLRGLAVNYVWLLGLQQTPRIHRTRRTLLFLAATISLNSRHHYHILAMADLQKPKPHKKGWRFVVIFCALCMTAFLSALDTSIISTALPTIAADLNSETLYVWTISSYLLVSTAVQPLFGQAANIFGRRSLTLLSVMLFLLGSGIAGGAFSTSFLLTFLHDILLYCACYFLAVYFQAVLNASLTRSGIMLFPIATTTAPFGVVAGILITASGHYRVFHFAGFALMAIACGLFTLLDASSSTGSWVGFQILFGTGAGFIFTSTLPAILAALPESEVATATATWAFLRSFGSIWGTAIPSAVFNSSVNPLLYTVPDEAARAWLKDGGAYQHAAREFLRTVRDTPVWPGVLNVYIDALRVVWYVSIAFAGIGVPLAFFIKGLHLREEVNTEFGMEIDQTHTETHTGQTETLSETASKA